MRSSPRRDVATGVIVAAAAALAVSLGMHPLTALELALVVVVLLLVGSVSRLVPRPPRPPRRHRDGGRTDVWGRAHATVAGSLRSRWWVDTSLRPAVREIVEARLAAGGVPFPAGPEAAARALPDDVVELVLRAGRRHDAAGLAPAELATLFDHLEEL